MSTKLEEARSLLAKRLEELERERKQLTEAISRLDSLADDGSAAKRSARSRSHSSSRRRQAGSGRNGTSRSGRRRKRAPRGEREKQLLSSIKANPDYRVSDHAREVGVSPQQLYPLLNRLIAKDAIVKKDSKYAITAS